jgi:opacity protein-like surface antigen
MKKPIQTHFLGIFLISLVAVMLTAAVCSAKEWSRKGKGEIFALGQYMGGDTEIFTIAGSKVSFKLDDTIAGGIGYGYNFSDYFNVNMDLSYGRTNSTSTLLGISFKDHTNLIAGDLNLDFNVLRSRLTPLVTGGIGVIRFKGAITEGFDFDESDFSYNVGGGVRWDVSDHFFIKAIYRSIWTKMKDADKSIRFNVGALSIGYIF